MKAQKVRVLQRKMRELGDKIFALRNRHRKLVQAHKEYAAVINALALSEQILVEQQAVYIREYNRLTVVRRPRAGKKR
jgi:transposase InsO family protein